MSSESVAFLGPQNTPKYTKIVGGWGFAQTPCSGGAYNAPQIL